MNSLAGDPRGLPVQDQPPGHHRPAVEPPLQRPAGLPPRAAPERRGRDPGPASSSSPATGARSASRSWAAGRRGRRCWPFVDDGVGLTEEEVHRFLATIGLSSKRDDDWERPEDFIGRFGIGLLSCFIVSDEIAVVTRSIRPSSPTIEWRGRPDGTYSVKADRRRHRPGHAGLPHRQAGLPRSTSRPTGSASWPSTSAGSCPYPIRVVDGEDVAGRQRGGRPLAAAVPPRARRRPEALLDFGREDARRRLLRRHPAPSPRPAASTAWPSSCPIRPAWRRKRTHRVYLKDMLLSETAEGLLARLGLLRQVRGQRRRPPADRLARVVLRGRDAGRRPARRWATCLRDYLVGLAARDPDRLQKLIALHDLSIKALAVEDDEFFRVFIDWLPFETSTGHDDPGRVPRASTTSSATSPTWTSSARSPAWPPRRALRHQRRPTPTTPSCWRGSPRCSPRAEVEAVDPSALAQTLRRPGPGRAGARPTRWSRSPTCALQPFRCAAEAKKFLPEELPDAVQRPPATPSSSARSSSRKEVADPLWSSRPGQPRPGPASADPYAQLCFNFRNPLVRKIAGLKRQDLAPPVGRDALRPGPAAGPSPAQLEGDGPAERGPDRPDRVGRLAPGKGADHGV